MNIYNKSSLKSYWIKHSTAKKTLELWFSDVSSKNWKKPNDVKKDYVAASVIGNNRIVFNIKGNDFRLIVEFQYQKGWGFIKFIGTHSEYDKIDAEKVDQFKSKKKAKKSN